MADQETIPIGLETQNKVAEAIYLRWYRNGRRHPRPWNEMATEDKEPWRRVAKDAKCILHVDGRSLNKAIRLWNYHASHYQRNEQ